MTALPVRGRWHGSARGLAWLALVTGAAVCNPLQAAALAPPVDGWSSWQVPAVAGAPDWCCLDWKNPEPRPQRCDLDQRGHGYGAHDDASVEHMRIYARLQGGQVQQIRTLGPTCAVHANTTIADLGAVAVEDSARWLSSRIGSHRRLNSDLLAALAVHNGPVARDALARVATSDSERETRKDAVFWMGQVRASDSLPALQAIMFEDADPKLREHAAFSLSQSKAPDRAAALIRLGRTDASAKVRAQAWFWLSQTAAAESEAALFEALTREADDDVREEIVFALSQLPDERAVAALGRLLEDRGMARETRERALFWLSQSDSPQAQAWLQQVLDP